MDDWTSSRLPTKKGGFVLSDHIRPLGGIRSCACSAVVQIIDGVKREWASGDRHTCDGDALTLMDEMAERALAGDPIAAFILPAAVNVWLTK
jgi:hypothetical protein